MKLELCKHIPYNASESKDSFSDKHLARSAAPGSSTPLIVQLVEDHEPMVILYNKDKKRESS